LEHRNFLFWVAAILSIYVPISLTDTFKIYIQGKDECKIWEKARKEAINGRNILKEAKNDIEKFILSPELM
jgi:hypothetical protein